MKLRINEYRPKFLEIILSCLDVFIEARKEDITRSTGKYLQVTDQLHRELLHTSFYYPDCQKTKKTCKVTGTDIIEFRKRLSDEIPLKEGVEMCLNECLPARLKLLFELIDPKHKKENEDAELELDTLRDMLANELYRLRG